MKKTIYNKHMYYSPFGSLTLIRKIFNPSIAVNAECKEWEKLYNKTKDESVLKSYHDMTKAAVIKPFILMHYNTIRGPIYRLELDGEILPLREDLFPDPAFITKSEKSYD